MSARSIPRWWLFLLALLALPAGAGAAPDPDADGDGLSDALEARLGLLPAVKQVLLPVATSPNQGWSAEEAALNAPDILSLSAGHVGGRRFLFRVDFAHPPVFADSTFIVYLDLDSNPRTGRQDQYHGGVDVMVSLGNNNVSLPFHSRAFDEKNTSAAVAVEGNALFVSLDAPVPAAGDGFAIGVHLLSQRKDRPGDSTRHAVAQLPRSEQAVSVLPARARAGLRPLTDYRYHNDVVKLEKLEDKGLTFAQVAPAKPIQFGRPRPLPPFAAAGRRPAQAGSVSRRRVPLQLLEEAGVARAGTPVTCGLPLPKGALFDLERTRVLSPDGRDVPAQFAATSFWPDDSLKWVLVDFATPLKAREAAEYSVEFGGEVRPTPAASPLRVEETPAGITVTTGPLKAVVDRTRFRLLAGVWRDANGDGKFADDEQVLAPMADGLRLVDEGGKVFTTANRPPESVRVEEQGPRKVVVRAEGAYAAAGGETYMRCAVRLTFRAGSPRVEVAITHLNDYVKTEFTDITSLALPLAPAGGVKQAALYLADGAGKLQPTTGRALFLFQTDESRCVLRADGQSSEGGKAPGVIRCTGGQGTVTAAVHEFWQRWPKGLTADTGGIAVELLPPQPGPDYGADLPHHLMYPFASGKYRFKWGVSFTQRVTLDFDPAARPEEVLADANSPVVAVIPAAWYAETGALGPLAAPAGKQFAAWDTLVERHYAAHLRRKAQAREYGYLNYGDWFGERGRNWGNNEYDLAHGFFTQFARTGRRDYQRLALAAARHQADVDCVHAYPDPYYVGANHQHSIGHTGTWSQEPQYATWSHKYDVHTSADGGHTWADGMLDAWYLTGDARVMESALGLGEHIAWAMSRDFKNLGTHERSAGWSLVAIMALYRGTYDREYLEAAKRIVAVPVREQKLEQGGAWPHVLPRDHAGDTPGAVGNNLFLIGVLLDGLKAYHQETGDPAVLKSLTAAVNWIAKSWDGGAEGWPYSAMADGKPLYKPSISLNTLIIEPLAYVGSVSGDERLLGIAEAALAAVTREGGNAFGKSIAQDMVFTAGTMALLQRWYAAHRPDQGAAVMDGSEAGVEVYAAKAPVAAAHRVRAPNEKRFLVRLGGAAAELRIVRAPHGAMTKAAESGTVRVLDARGGVVKEAKFSTDDPYEMTVPLAGRAGDEFQVVVDDDQRGVWSLSGPELGIVAQTVTGFRIGGVGRARYHFFVPAGTRRFQVRLLGAHGGTYGAAAFTPAGKCAGYHQGVNEGQVLVAGAPKVEVPNPNAHPEQGVLTITPDPADTGKVWGLALWAAGDLGVELEGVPPYLSLDATAWFAPGE